MPNGDGGRKTCAPVAAVVPAPKGNGGSHELERASSSAPFSEGVGVSSPLNAADDQLHQRPRPLARPVGPMPTLWQATRLALIIFAALAVIGLLAQSVHPGH